MLTVKKSEYEHLKARDELLARLLVSGVENTECWKVAKGIGQGVRPKTAGVTDCNGNHPQAGHLVSFECDNKSVWEGIVRKVGDTGIFISQGLRPDIFRAHLKFSIKESND